jgi:cytochrome c oxidase subunit 2
MFGDGQQKKRRVLIASSHGLFAQGLHSLLRERQATGVEVVGVVTSLEQAMAALEKLTPDLIIVDYDDQALNRDEFLARFVESEMKLRVVLLSLQSAQDAIVYDRRTLSASQIDDWLEEWSTADDGEVLPTGKNEAISPAKHGRVVMKNRSKSLIHLVVVSILTIISTVVVFMILQNIRLMPEQASQQAISIDNLFRGELAVISFLFSLIVVFMLYSIFVFRRKKGDMKDASHVEGNTRLEITWTVLPLITVFVFAIWGGQSLREVTRPEPRPLIVNVIGQQWAWRFEYPQEGADKIVSDKLYLPVDKPVLLRLSSADVIHSFWVPEFRVKQDALPGGEEFVRPLRVTPSKIGNYKLRCAELCGVQHTTMESDVLVVSQIDFDTWTAEQSGESPDPVVRGERVARNYGCLACHSIDGTALVGPTWLAAFGETVQLSDGTTVLGDEAYLRESILNPNAKIVAGFAAGIMPQNFATQMTEKQINDVIEYIKSLK